MFVFDWIELATDSVLDRLHAIVGLDGPADYPESLRRTLADVYRLVGGLNVSPTALDAVDRDVLALTLLDEACEHAVSLLTSPGTTPGYILAGGQPDFPFDATVLAHTVVSLNTATAAELEELPGIGPTLATEIIDVRRAAGWFESPEELDERVRGIGPAVLKQTAHVLSYKPPVQSEIEHARDLDGRLRLLYALSGPAGTPLTTVLELLVTTCGRRPHPDTVRRRQRVPTAMPVDMSPANWVAVLANEDYQPAVGSLFGEATTTIEICMFHIALGAPGHPTRMLLDNLVAAKDRGVSVRVTLDRDRPTDPYRSTVINSPAKEYLEAHGVPVRWDTEERLLHSKFVLVDGAIAVIGSHNWSVGSYAEYDEVSLAIASMSFVATLLSRFDALWEAGDANQAPRGQVHRDAPV